MAVCPAGGLSDFPLVQTQGELIVFRRSGAFMCTRSGDSRFLRHLTIQIESEAPDR